MTGPSIASELGGYAVVLAVLLGLAFIFRPRPAAEGGEREEYWVHAFCNHPGCKVLLCYCDRICPDDEISACDHGWPYCAEHHLGCLECLYLRPTVDPAPNGGVA